MKKEGKIMDYSTFTDSELLLLLTQAEKDISSRDNAQTAKKVVL